ncbi:hypothetical protein BGX34_009784, partial [Mortierella sp. NVP85]
YKRKPLNAVQYNRRSRDLVWKDDTFKNFPVGRMDNFKTLLSALISVSMTRRTSSWLSNYKPLFEGLAIDEHVTNNRISPGQFFVLRLDFSAVDRSQDRNEAEHNLNRMLIESIRTFYRTYEPYLRMSADYLIKNYTRDDAVACLNECANLVYDTLKHVDSPENPLSKIKGIYIMADEYDNSTNEYLALVTVHWKPPRGDFPGSLLRGFWATVKSKLGRGISKCYMTGVTPLYLGGRFSSGFNVAWPVSWEPTLAGFGGLKEADVAAALAQGGGGLWDYIRGKEAFEDHEGPLQRL